MGTHSNEILLRRIERFQTWCAAQGVVTKNTRVDRYSRYLRWIVEQDADWDLWTDSASHIFTRSPHSPIQHGLDRYLYVLREVHELSWISEGLASCVIPGIAEKLAIVVAGADFAALDRKSTSRDTQFELRIASYFARLGYFVSLSGLTDVVARRHLTTYHVECKRIASPRQLRSRIGEATHQLRERLPQSKFLRPHHGLIAADVTKVAFSHNGLTLGATPDHSRDVIQQKLKEIVYELMGPPAYLPKRPAVGLFVQIHIPSLILTPPSQVTRFSSYFILSADKPTFRSLFGALRLKRQLLRVKKDDPGDTPFNR